MKSGNNSKLSIMMFLQYAVWGAWLPVLSQYLQAPTDKGGLGFTGLQVGMILGLAGSIGAVTSPFIGNLADRMFSTERCLATLMLLGGVLKWITAYQTNYYAWVVLSIVYSVIYMPTISLSNSMVFANVGKPDKEFPMIRVWGTIGWIAASWIFPWIFLQHDLEFQKLPPFLMGTEYKDHTARLSYALMFSGVISLGYSAFCLLLPHTPPKTGVKELALTKAVGLFKRSSFALLVIASLPISMIHQIYFIKTGPFLSHIGFKDSYIGPVMSIGQFFEIGVMASLGFLLAKLGFKWTIVLGAMCYFLRYAVFGTTSLDSSVIAASQALHGFCFSCFFAAGFIYVDRLAPEDIRHSAQTVFGIIILGIGPVLGGWLMGPLEKAFTPAIVAELKDDSPMYAAGLRKGDVFKTVEGKPVTLSADCLAQLKSIAGGAPTVDKVKVEVERAGKSLQVELPGPGDKKADKDLPEYLGGWGFGLDYSKFWYVLSAIGLATAVLVAALFRDETQGKDAPLSKDVADEAGELAS